MSDSKDFASLSPRLLARKGGARPAMRPPVQPIMDFPADPSGPEQDDLGRNDMGASGDDLGRSADVVLISGAAAFDETGEGALAHDLLIRRKAFAGDIARPQPSRGSALAKGARAAFTLRIDADRHFKLRLACAATNRSAQQLLIEALDRMLVEMPEIRPMAAEARKRR